MRAAAPVALAFVLLAGLTLLLAIQAYAVQRTVLIEEFVGYD
jgi:hypothetical protein